MNVQLIFKREIRPGLRGLLGLCCLLGLCVLVGCQPESDDQGADVSKPRDTVEDQAKGPIFFQDITEASGLDFVHHIGQQNKYFLPDIVAGGCGIFDFNRDGLMDLVLVESGDFEKLTKGTVGQNESQGCNRIYQQTSPGKFQDVTDSLELNSCGYGCGVAIADVNNDGFNDLYFSNYGDDKLFLNEQGTRFRDVTSESGIKNPSWGTSATFFDFDRDGRLDLFVTNYVSYLPETNCSDAGVAEDFCSPQVFGATVDRLFRNESEGTKIRFRDVTVEMGIAKKKGPGLGVISRDFDLDGYPDLYVANDGKANFLWINQSGKSFVDQASLMGCAMSIKGEAQAGMGVAEADIDQNGVADIVVTHIDGETNAAYLGSFVKSDSGQQLFYTESGGAKGVQKISKPMTGFGIALPDLDNNGTQDMLTVNGRVSRREREPGPDLLADYAERNQISLNRGAGEFEETSSDDPFSREIAVSRGLALGDVNNDGRLDCLVTNTGTRARLFQNQFADSGNWIGFQVTNPQFGDRPAIGARIQIKLSDGSARTRTIQTDGSYLSASDPRAHFGLGSEKTIRSIQVTWPDQTKETFAAGRLNQYHDIKKGAGQPAD